MKTSLINYAEQDITLFELVIQSKIPKELMTSLIEILRQCGVKDNVHIIYKEIFGKYIFYNHENKKKF